MDKLDKVCHTGEYCITRLGEKEEEFFLFSTTEGSF